MCIYLTNSFALCSYCDVFQKCREVDPSGPLATLRKLLLSEESIASFKKWMQHHWYTVALAAIGVFLLLVSTVDYIVQLPLVSCHQIRLVN